MSQSKTIVAVENVHKYFRLPHEGVSSVKSIFVNPFRKGTQKRTERQYALKDINFEVQEGEFFGIVGRNGSGKSTLLKLIANIYRPTQGKIQVNGRLVPFIELGVGFNPELTGRENVYLNGALMGFSSKEVDEKYDAIVDFAELERFMDQKLKNYSSGMQVRLAFSVATILADSDVLLIDEVLAVGDAAFQRKCFNYFRTLKKQKKTVIFVSHDMEAVREYCDRCILLDESRILYTGSPEVAAEKYVKLFNDSKLSPQEHDKEADRWGVGDAKVSQVEAMVERDVVRIQMKVDFLDGLQEPILGFSIKNAAGQVICGTNNKILKRKLGDFSRGDSVNVEWAVPNIFGDDEYIIESAVTHRDGVTQSDWWHSAGGFSVRNDESTPHLVSPRVTMSVD